MSEEEPMDADEPVNADEDAENGAAEDDNNEAGETESQANNNNNNEEENNEETASGQVSPDFPVDTRTPLQRAMQAIPPNKDEPFDVPWKDILAFYEVFGKTLEGEELEKFTKRFNPEKKENLNTDKALPAFTEFIGKDDFILMLQTESQILDPLHNGYVHHEEDFRMMMKELGEEIPDDLINDFIREALGKGDDEFDINVYIQFMCQETKFVEEVKKSKVGR